VNRPHIPEKQHDDGTDTDGGDQPTSNLKYNFYDVMVSGVVDPRQDDKQHHGGTDTDGRGQPASYLAYQLTEVYVTSVVEQRPQDEEAPVAGWDLRRGPGLD
jgi:hypothetical protein